MCCTQSIAFWYLRGLYLPNIDQILWKSYFPRDQGFTEAFIQQYSQNSQENNFTEVSF